MRFRAALFLGALLLATHAGSVFGQGFQGGLRGSIKDAGGVIPGVEVTLTNEQTNIKRSVVTNERGEYVFANVDPGTYGVKATLQGYKSIDRGSVRIGTQQFLTLDLLMEVGAITENVTVTGEAPLIETSNASKGTVLDSNTLQTLPAPGRNAFMVGVSVPTVIPSGDAQFNRQQDQTNVSLASLGGGTRRGNNYTLDGVPITDSQNRPMAIPTIEAVDDLKIQVHTYDAEMGRTGGGVYNTTLKSGSNLYHGAGYFQSRPVWAQTNNYFSAIAGLPNAAGPYYLGGGAVGGAIVKDRTFFWIANEDYHDISTRNIGVTMPTSAERAGDFSGLVTSAGAHVTIYDPLTHLPFPGNIIPANRINPVAANMVKYLPLPTTNPNVDNGAINYNITSTLNDKFQQEYTFKVEHKFTDKVSLSGFYLYNRTDEPCADYFFQGQDGPNRFADPNNYILARRPKILALNNTWVLSDNSVMSLRFGLTRFPDNNTVTASFDPTSLGFASNYATQINPAFAKFPYVDIIGYDQQGRTLGAINPTNIDYKSTAANASFSKFFGTHTIKAGADFRKLGVDTFIPGNSNGNFVFDKEFTSSTGLTANDTLSGNALASFLLGYPSGNTGNLAQLTTTTAANIYTYYYGGYLQDDWRVSSKFTLNYGVRIEHEDGMREVNNAFTVGFDPTATSALSSITIPGDAIAGTGARPVAGGLMFAGVNGNPTTQGNPPKLKWSPRVGTVYSINSSTVLRAGYGLFWAPYNYTPPSPTAQNYGQVGYTLNTLSPQTAGVPTVTLTNPFPNGVLQPSGNSLGALAGVGTNINFVDQNRTAPRVQQYSADLQKELGHGMAVTVSYVGARGDHLGLGGTVDSPVNINQLDPKYISLGAALTQQVANPFFGVAAAGPLATSATIPRYRLLLPYPQFNQVNAREVTEGMNRYNAGIIEWSKRVTHGWGGRISYTYSQLKDNQFGETNFYSRTGLSNNTGLPLNNYNYVASAPACQGNTLAACYAPTAEYGYSMLDVPHRVIVAPTFELPFGKGKRWGSQSQMADLLAGGWQISWIWNLQSGFPINLSQSDNLGGTMQGSIVQRPNIVSGSDPTTPGGYADRLSSADHPTATWVNAAAFSLAPAFSYGNAPRTITAVRTPTQDNVDLSIIKSVRLGGAKSAQLKFEVLNLFNRVTMRGNSTSNTVGSTNFEQWNQQSGFQRLLQVMARFNF
jgi:trimeric autotransporter adhesin